MVKQKICSTRLSGFSEAKAYIWHIDVLKKHYNAIGQTYCDAITVDFIKMIAAS